MLTIGEFSNICRVSAKTLRYYAEIGLILPEEINPETGYRYYSVRQLEKMLLINRLKTYCFSLEEIKGILDAGELQEEVLAAAIGKKKKEIGTRVRELQGILAQMDKDLENLETGKSVMSYLKTIDVQLVEALPRYLLSVRKHVLEQEFPEEYRLCFGRLLREMQEKGGIMAAPPMVLFHSREYQACGMDTEFALPVREYAAGIRNFCPGLCLKTVVRGAYSQLPSVYAKQIEWAEKEGYENNGPLYEIYVTSPAEVLEESDLVTEVYYPVKKLRKCIRKGGKSRWMQGDAESWNKRSGRTIEIR